MAQQQDEKDDVAVKITNLSFKYESHQALKNINLEVPRGSRCVLFGANGFVSQSRCLKYLSMRFVSRSWQIDAASNRGWQEHGFP